MPGRQGAVAHHLLHSGGQRQQAQKVCDVAAAFRQGLGQLFLRVAEAVHQHAEGGCFFDGVQVGALDVLDQATSRNSTSSSVRTSTGTSCRPAACAARQRRSPATISYCPVVAAGRTIRGCSTPSGERNLSDPEGRRPKMSCGAARGWAPVASIGRRVSGRGEAAPGASSPHSRRPSAPTTHAPIPGRRLAVVHWTLSVWKWSPWRAAISVASSR